MKYASAEDEFWNEMDEYLACLMEEGLSEEEAFAEGISEYDEYWRVLQEEYGETDE